MTSTPPPNSDIPYLDWDPRHAPRNYISKRQCMLYLQEAKRPALQEEAASIKLQRWLTKRYGILNMRFCSAAATNGSNSKDDA
mmetsp:Transcript_22246/g.36562  ORF Transcript_22246/g.36562 Transcript_22246/m.36562 type:complete len:83 (-) Transcript_22246:741-989(-)|eukprot:scaffold1366_cov155-Skeletonema_menzelii.AAC.9